MNKVLETGFKKLEQNIVDVIKESQIKLGYSYSKMRLYYALETLNHTLGISCTVDEMTETLNNFREYTSERLGMIEISNTGDRFEIAVSADGVKYIHEHFEVSEFLEELVYKVSVHGCTMEEILKVFEKYSEHVIIKEMDNDEFDYLVYFEDGNPDDYRYCFHNEGDHIIYHRFQYDDYKEFGWE